MSFQGQAQQAQDALAAAQRKHRALPLDSQAAKEASAAAWHVIRLRDRALYVDSVLFLARIPFPGSVWAERPGCPQPDRVLPRLVMEEELSVALPTGLRKFSSRTQNKRGLGPKTRRRTSLTNWLEMREWPSFTTARGGLAWCPSALAGCSRLAGDSMEIFGVHDRRPRPYTSQARIDLYQEHYLEDLSQEQDQPGGAYRYGG